MEPQLRQLGRYEIIEEIGHGGMATVYRGRDPRLDRDVAIKVLHPHLRGAAEARSRFSREAKSVARLRHANIVEIYDNSEDSSDESFIVTELLTGPTLKRFAEEHGAMPPEVAAAVVVEILSALEHAHRAGIVHRDVKPENVLLHQNQAVKLTDFGIAQMVDAQSFTATGQILGSPGHMSPEQVEGKDCDPRTDVFAAGTVLYYLAVGRLPFVGTNPHQIIRKLMEGEYTDPQRVDPRVGAHFSRIVSRAMSRKPDERYATATEFQKALRSFLAEVGVHEPRKLMFEHFQNPAAVRERLREQVIQHCLAAARTAAGKAKRSKRHRGALKCAVLDHCNRVLALDDGNEEALALVDHMSSHPLRWTPWAWAAAGLVTMAAAAGLLWWSAARGAIPPLVNGRGASGIHRTLLPIPLNATRAARPTPTDAAERRPARVRDDNRPRAASGRNVRRTVEFRPVPQNVSISVNGGPFQPFGPAFHEVSLPPGMHEFKFVGAEHCCLDRTVRSRIPPGPGRTIVDARLSYRPAGLYVITAVPARVTVNGGAIVGRSRNVIQVPLSRAIAEKHRIRIEAPGHNTQESAVLLQAGKVKEVRVNLTVPH